MDSAPLVSRRRLRLSSSAAEPESAEVPRTERGPAVARQLREKVGETYVEGEKLDGRASEERSGRCGACSQSDEHSLPLIGPGDRRTESATLAATSAPWWGGGAGDGETAGGGETAGAQRDGGGKPEQRSSRAGDGGAESAAAGVGAEARRRCRRLGVAAARRRGDERGRGRRGRWRRLRRRPALVIPCVPPLSVSLAVLSSCSHTPHPLSPARPFCSPPGCVRSHERQRRRVLRLLLRLLQVLLLDSGNGGGGGGGCCCCCCCWVRPNPRPPPLFGPAVCRRFWSGFANWAAAGGGRLGGGGVWGISFDISPVFSRFYRRN